MDIMDKCIKTNNPALDQCLDTLHSIFGKNIDPKATGVNGDTNAALGVTKIANIKALRDATALDLNTSRQVLDWIVTLVTGPFMVGSDEAARLRIDLGYAQREVESLRKSMTGMERSMDEVRMERDTTEAKIRARDAITGAARRVLDALDSL